jgi:hypothetical protein
LFLQLGLGPPISNEQQEMIMPALILWLLGVPLSVIILLYLIF